MLPFSFFLRFKASIIIALLLAGFGINAFTQVNIPYEQKFLTASFPTGWTVQYSGITATIWSISNSNNTGGGIYEAKASSAYQTGISRLVTPALLTTGLSELKLSFRQQLSVFNDIGMLIKIQSSSDAINWTDEEYLGSSLLGSIPAEYHSIMINNNLGNTTYLAFVVEGNHSEFISWSIDDVYVGQFTVMPQCPYSLKPNPNETNVPLIGALKWKTGSYSLGSTLFIGTDNPPTNLVNGMDLGLATQYDYPPLLPNTQYRWKVTSYNSIGIQPFCSNDVFTTMPAITMPYSESFGSYSFPTGWVPQVYSEVGNVPVWELSSSIHGGGSTYELQCETDFEYAKGVSRLISPPINTSGYTEISLGMTHKIKSIGAGLVFKIQTSADGINWTDEQVWSSASGNIGPEPFTLAIHHNLGDYTFISFMLEGDFSDFLVFGGWYIDNIAVSGVIGTPACVTQVLPVDSSAGIAPGYNLRWTPIPAANGYKLYLGTDNPPTNIYDGLDVGNIHKENFTSLLPGQTYYWSVVPYNQNGPATGCPVKVFFTTPAQTLPFAEDFNNPVFPPGWLAQWTGLVDSTIWYIRPFTFPPLAPYIMKAEGNYRDDRGISRMILPPFDADSAYNLSLAFKYFLYTYDTGLIIRIQSSPDCRNWTDQDWSITSNTNENQLSYLKAKVPIPANNGGISYIAFVVEGNLDGLEAWYIDSVRVQKTYTRPDCNSTPSPPNASAGVGLNSILKWNKNTGAMGYRLYFGTDNPPTNILNGLDIGADTCWHETVFGSSTQYFWKAVPYNNAGDAYNCPVWSFTTTSPLSLPFSESFNSSTMPPYWSIEQFGKNVTWSHAHWNSSSGIQGEMQAEPIDSYFLNQGTSRLISPPLNTTGLSMLTLSFRHTVNGTYPGIRLRIQTSSDGLHWSNESWFFMGGNGNINNDSITISLGQNIGSVTFIAFTLEGDLSAFHEWTVDKIMVSSTTTIPACSSYIYPPAGMIGAAELLKLKWDMNPSATSYRLNLGTDFPPTNVCYNLSTGAINEYSVGPLQQGTQYYWQVIPQTPAGSPSGCPIQSFTVTENKSLPYTDNFDENYFPAGWRQEYSGGVTNEIWSVADTNLAGGQSPELKAIGVNTYGTTRLISPPLNTSNCEYITLIFKHLYKLYYYDSEIHLQSSADGINWTDEESLFSGGYAMTIPSTISVKITHNLGAKTYLAFMVKRNHISISSWQIDNIKILPTYPKQDPEIFTISAPSFVCQGSSGGTITLSGSQLNAEYKLYRYSALVGSPITGTGLPISWPNIVAGIYNIIAKYNDEYAMMEGGKLISNAAKPLPNAGPDISTNPNVPVQLECLVTSGTMPYAYNWLPATGLNDPSIANPLATPTVTTSYIVSVTDANTCSNSDTVVVTVNPAGLSINGALLYQNNSPLSNCQVELVKDGVIVQTVSSDISGAFTFGNVEPGDYTFNVNINKAWGGGNAVDALLIMQHFVGLMQLTGLPLMAADLLSLGAINSIDALTVMRRFVGLITSFAVPDWIVENPTVTVSTSNVNVQIKAICAGDVNVSFVPPL